MVITLCALSIRNVTAARLPADGPERKPDSRNDQPTAGASPFLGKHGQGCWARGACLRPVATSSATIVAHPRALPTPLLFRMRKPKAATAAFLCMQSVAVRCRGVRMGAKNLHGGFSVRSTTAAFTPTQGWARMQFLMSVEKEGSEMLMLRHVSSSPSAPDVRPPGGSVP